MTVRIKVNGKEEEIPGKFSITDLILKRELNQRQLVISVNENIIQPEAYPDTPLTEGDAVEIMAFVGGG